MHFLVDRKYRLARIWSNNELKKFSKLFKGNIVNVSAWKDEDKEGGLYKEYFKNANSYTITNYKTEARGYQGNSGEIYLDLEKDLDKDLEGKFDVVFNHTSLEHIFKIEIAFRNLCLMSKDVVIVVVPFLQEMHSTYGDFWRFTPLALKRMFEENDFNIQYLSFNSHKNASVYLFCLAVRNVEKWKQLIPYRFSYSEIENPKDGFDGFVGSHAISNKLYKINFQLKHFGKRIQKRFIRNRKKRQ